MSTHSKQSTASQVITLPSIVIEHCAGQIKIARNNPNPGAPVIIEAKRLQSWLEKIYREGVLL